MRTPQASDQPLAQPDWPPPRLAAIAQTSQETGMERFLATVDFELESDNLESVGARLRTLARTAEMRALS